MQTEEKRASSLERSTKYGTFLLDTEQKAKRPPRPAVSTADNRRQFPQPGLLGYVGDYMQFVAKLPDRTLKVSKQIGQAFRG